MSETAKPNVRKGLFRNVAVQHYMGPLQFDLPHTLPRWRPGLVVAAVIVAIALAAVWI